MIIVRLPVIILVVDCGLVFRWRNGWSGKFHYRHVHDELAIRLGG